VPQHPPHSKKKKKKVYPLHTHASGRCGKQVNPPLATSRIDSILTVYGNCYRPMGSQLWQCRPGESHASPVTSLRTEQRKCGQLVHLNSGTRGCRCKGESWSPEVGFRLLPGPPAGSASVPTRRSLVRTGGRAYLRTKDSIPKSRWC
jgi:hypothetical protein